MKLFFIAASRGCGCCLDDDHVRGPYRSGAEAQRRVDSYLAPGGLFCPLTSHSRLSPRGSYQVLEVEALVSSDGRAVIHDRTHNLSLAGQDPAFVFVGRDGRTANDGAEWFSASL